MYVHHSQLRLWGVTIASVRVLIPKRPWLCRKLFIRLKNVEPVECCRVRSAVVRQVKRLCLLILSCGVVYLLRGKSILKPGVPETAAAGCALCCEYNSLREKS